MDFEELYQQYYRQVYGYAMTLCRNPHDARDITDETFFRAFGGYHRFRGDCSPGVWLCQIAKNLFLSRCRKKSLDCEAGPEPFEDVLAEKLEDREEAMEIHRHLHMLKEPYKEVFMLRVFGELSFGQIGGIFGKTDSWARVTFFRAKTELLRQMGR